jgi:hypothetical protein
MVLELGGLLPQQVLATYLAYAVNHGGSGMENIAFERVVFLKEVPDTLANWVRDRLSREAINARQQVDVLRLEALSARLPSSLGTIIILKRCQMIKNLRWPLKVINPLEYLYMSINIRKNRPVFVLFNEIFFPLYLFFLWSVGFSSKQSQNKTLTLVGPNVMTNFYDELTIFYEAWKRIVSMLLVHSFLCLSWISLCYRISNITDPI